MFFAVNEEPQDVVFEVEDLLSLAIEERRGKQEAKHVLSQLQENYDQLQRKYAQAEIIIDKYRYSYFYIFRCFLCHELSNAVQQLSRFMFSWSKMNAKVRDLNFKLLESATRTISLSQGYFFRRLRKNSRRKKLKLKENG